MFKARKRLFTGLLLAGLLLTSCGSKADEVAVPVASPDDPGTIVTVQGFTGKIKSISGNEVTLYKADSAVQASADPVPGTSAGTNSAEPAEGETGQASGNEPAGEQQPSATEAESKAQNTPDSSQASPLQFTEETVTITVDDNTEFVQSTGASKSADEASADGKYTLADLKAGDVIKVTLKADSLTAAIIEVQATLATGGGNMTAEPSPGTSPSPQPSASPGGKPSPGAGEDGKPLQSPGAAPGGKDGQAPAGGKGGGKGGTPPSGAPGAAPGGRPGAGGAPDPAGAAAQPGASARPGASASASAKPGASASAGAKPAEGNPAAALSFGKIKSISGSTITLYTAEAPSAPPQNGAGPAGAAEGETPASRPVASPGASGGGQPGNMPQGGGQMSFSETTKVITVTSSTKLLSVTFDNGTRSEASLALSALQAGDIIQYTLKTGTTQAESIMLSSGGQ